jgi:DNA-binding transcriptional ArsR family regulator
MNGDAAVQAMSALAQEPRLAAYRELVQAGTAGLAAGVIASRLGIPASSASFHLAHLVRSGLVGQRREGRSRIYMPDYQAMARLIAYLTENCSGGAGCGVPGCGTDVEELAVSLAGNGSR